MRGADIRSRNRGRPFIPNSTEGSASYTCARGASSRTIRSPLPSCITLTSQAPDATGAPPARSSTDPAEPERWINTCGVPPVSSIRPWIRGTLALVPPSPSGSTITTTSSPPSARTARPEDAPMRPLLPTVSVPPPAMWTPAPAPPITTPFTVTVCGSPWWEPRGPMTLRASRRPPSTAAVPARLPAARPAPLTKMPWRPPVTLAPSATVTVMAPFRSWAIA